MLDVNQESNQSAGYGIGELASEFSVTSRALRLYEEEKLLNPERVGTKRLYSERDRVRLRLILRGKRLGWSLAEIRESFELYDSSHGEEAQLELLLAKVEERRQLLETQKADIEKSLEDIERISSNAHKALKQIRAEPPKPPAT
jgi:DNA-binding transcriptional MerR regulator